MREVHCRREDKRKANEEAGVLDFALEVARYALVPRQQIVAGSRHRDSDGVQLVEIDRRRKARRHVTAKRVTTIQCTMSN